MCSGSSPRPRRSASASSPRGPPRWCGPARPGGWPGSSCWRAPSAIGLLVRLAFLDRLPLSFAVVATCALGVLLLGWRGLAAAVAHRVAHRVR